MRIRKWQLVVAVVLACVVSAWASTQLHDLIITASSGSFYSLADTALGASTTPVCTTTGGVFTNSGCAFAGGWTSGNNTNGYWIKDPLGHLHEWGHLTGESTSCNLITFPAAFTTLASIAPSATDDFAVGSSIQHSIVVSPSHGCTGISISAMYDWVSSTGGNGVWWTADGY